MGQREIKRIISGLSKILPQWCNLVCLPKGFIIRLDIKGMQIGLIKLKITEHFEKKHAQEKAANQ